MASISWKSGINGDWNNAADWTGGMVPNAGDTVSIAASGNYTVAIDHNEAVQSLQLKAAGATVSVSGTDVLLTLGTSFAVSAGTLSLTGNDTVIDQPRITGGTLSTGTAGIILVNAVAGDTGGDEFDVNSAVSLAGTTTIASGAFLALGGGGSLGGTIGGGGELGLGDLAYTAKAASFAASLGQLSVEGNGSLLLSGASGAIAAPILLANTGTIAIASGTAITLSNALQVGVGALLDYQYNNLLTGPGTLTTAGGGELLDAGTGTDMLLLGGGISWTNTGSFTDFGQIAMNTVSADKVTITNAGSGIFILEGGDANLLTHGAFTDGKDTFVNAGLLQRLPNPGDGSGAGTISFAAALDSTGTIDVETGTLATTDGGTLSGTLSGAGTLLLYSGTYTIGALSGSGHLSVGTGATVTYTNSTVNTGYTLDDNETLAIAAGKTFVIGGAFTIGDSTGGGTLAGPGTLSTTGSTTINDLGGAVALSLQNNAVWSNTGTVTDDGIGSYNTPGSDGGTETILNKGVFTFAGPDAGFTLAANGTDIFNNTGTLNRTGSGTSLLNGTLNSTGTINIAGGVLQSQRGGGALSGTLSGAGTLALGDTGYTTTGLAGTGTLALNNNYGVGTLTATATSLITDSLQIDGGATLAVAAGKTLTLSGTLAIGSSTTYPNGAVFSGAGLTAASGTITTTGATTITDQPGAVVLSLQNDITWNNTGTVTDYGTGSFNTSGSDGGTETILNKGVFTLAGPDAGFALAANGTDIFNNTGTLNRTGSGTSLLNGTLNNTGTINIAGGVLQAQRGGGALTGTLSGVGTLALGDTGYTTTGLAGTGTLALNDNYGVGTLTATATSTITDSLLIDGAATLAVTAGKTLTLSGPVTIGGSTLYPNGGVFSGSILTSGTTTIIDQPGAQVLDLQNGSVWSNTGTVTDAGLGAYNTSGLDGGTVTLLNKGVFILAGADAGFSLAANGTDSLSNTGTLLRNGAGTSTIDSRIAITNTGTIEAASGKLSLAGGISGTGILKIDAGATLDIGNTPTSQSVTLTGGAGATLQMEAPISRALAGFTAGDRLDFANAPVSTASISGTTLTVVTGSGSTAYISAGLAGDVAAISTDGAGGSFVGIYRAATATHAPEPLAFGNHHKGDSTGNTLALTVSNTSVADGYSEKLNAGFGSASAGFTASGTATGIAAGASNSISLTAVLDTSAAGTKTGTATLALASNGAGIDGRGLTTLPSQTVTLTGAVYNYAAAALASTSIALGNQHVGSTPSAFLTLTNTAATGGYSEALDAKFTAATGSGTGTGTASLIAAGASSSTALSVGLSPAAAGVATGSATLAFISDGTGTSGLGTTTLGTQAISITGTFYNLAAGKLAAATIAFGNHHVGDTVAAKAVGLTNGAANGAFSEKLNASLSTASNGLTVAGTITGLAAGSSNTTALKVTDTATKAGALAGTVVVGLVSDGTGIDGLGTTSLLGQTITVTGANYALASGTLASSTLSLGIIHAGTAAAGTLTLTNGAPTGGYGESLDAGLSGASAGLSASGSLNGLRAGATDSATLKLTVNTAATGAYTGSAVLGLVSDGAGTSGLGTTTLGTQTVNVTATVDNYALALLEDPSGPALTGTSTNETLNLGSTLQGSAALTATIGVQNAATAIADQLGGTFSSAGGAGFTDTGLGTFSLLSAGAEEHAQSVSLATGTAGTFSETVTLSSFGTNASGYLGALAPETLTIIGTITPSVFHTYTLAVGPNIIHGADGLGDIFIAAAGALNTRDQLTGGSGANSLVLSGAGLFDINAPSVFTNIPAITAYEGQAASGTLADSRQTILMRDSASETLSVTAGTAAAGNTNAEAITIYAYTGTDSIALAAGADQLFLGTGTATVKLGGVANSVTAGGGNALITSTAALAGAAIIGTATGSTTLEITNAGTATLNTADTYVTVKLDAAGSLKLSPLGFITAIGSSSADTLTAMGGTQTLTGGAGKDTLIGAATGHDNFADAAAGLNGDTIQNWTTGDVLDLKDIVAANLSPLTFSGGTLTVTDGSKTAAITFSTGQSLTNFTVTGSDGAGGTLIAYHT